MSAKTIATIVLVFIVLAIGQITYVDHAKMVNEHEKQTAFCAQRPEIARHPSCMYHDPINPPSLMKWVDNWGAGASPFLTILVLMYIAPLTWRFFLNRLREISRAIRGMD